MKKTSLILSILLLFAAGVVGEEDGNQLMPYDYDGNNPECLLYGLRLDADSRTISNEPKVP